MTTARERLAEAGIQLSTPLTPGGAYVPYVWSGNQLFVAGQICRIGEEMQYQGVVGADLTVEEGQAAARLCAVNVLSVVSEVCGGDLTGVRLLSLNGFVRCTPDFEQQARVMDGASEVFLEALGDDGRHVRTAVGAYALPRRSPVEISTIFEVVRDAR